MPDQLEPTQKDVIIIGGGPSGLSLALALAPLGLDIAVIDKQHADAIAEPEMDGRDIALTHLSRTILEKMQVWQRIDKKFIHPLEKAEVINGSSPLALHFEREDHSKEPLGFLIANHRIRRALHEQVLSHKNIELLLQAEVSSISTAADQAEVTITQKNGSSTLRASLVVGADSRFSSARRMMGIGAKMKDYGRVMIVCNMRHEASNHNTARENFLYGKTCAILPLGENKSSIVITVPASEASRLQNIDADEFSAETTHMFNGCLGDMELVSERFSYPLIGCYSDKFIATRFALVGDAAVGMHPVTAHGYNLALRSVDTLAAEIARAQRIRLDIGSQEVLRAYQRKHWLVSRPIYDVTNAIVRLYTDDRPLPSLVRSAAINISDHVKPFKQLVTHMLTRT